MSSIHNLQDEVSIIQAEIVRVEEMISQLQVKRVKLLQRLNNAQSSTRALAPEILSLIFWHAIVDDRVDKLALIPDFRNKRDHIFLVILGHVSSYWRAVAWSTPHLWTSMSAGLDRRRRHLVPEILKLHLQNVSNHSFSLELGCFRLVPPVHFEGEGMFEAYIEDVQNTLAPIKSIINRPEYATKIHCLALIDPPRGWLQSVLNQLTNLKCFQLESDVVPDTYISLAASPQLHYVALRGRIPDIELPWTAITTLELDRLESQYCANLLLKCPNLVKFYSTNPVYRRERRTFPGPTTTFNHLTDFTWASRASNLFSEAVFQRIRLPALRTFTENGVPEVAIRAFFKDLPNTLEAIHLNPNTSWTRDTVRYVFSQCISVKEVDLDIRSAPVLSAILPALCPGNDGEMFLPSLRSLTLCHGNHYGGNVLGHWFSSYILLICQGRWKMPGFELVVRVPSFQLEWAPGVFEELRTMVQAGLKLKLVSYGMTIEWSSLRVT